MSQPMLPLRKRSRRETGGLQADVYLSTRFPTPSGFIQDLPVGAQQGVELNWTFTLDDPSSTQFRLLFHRTGVVDVEDTS